MFDLFFAFVVVTVLISFVSYNAGYNNGKNKLKEIEEQLYGNKLYNQYKTLLRDYIELDVKHRKMFDSQLIQDDSYFDNEHIQRQFESAQIKRNGNIVEYTLKDGSKYHIVD